MGSIINVALMGHNNQQGFQMAEEMTQRGAAIKFGFAFESNETAHLWHSNDVTPDIIIQKMEQMLHALKTAQAKKKKK